eukprot:1159913-Prorocentrum_minimum.AAC.1
MLQWEAELLYEEGGIKAGGLALGGERGGRRSGGAGDARRAAGLGDLEADLIGSGGGPEGVARGSGPRLVALTQEPKHSAGVLTRPVTFLHSSLRSSSAVG